MAEVYWIHLPEHTDMFTEGYIGITSRTTKERFKAHIKESKRKDRKKYRIHNVIAKYLERLIVDTLVICDDDYAIELEAKLRPSSRIGWNTVAGGQNVKLVRDVKETNLHTQDSKDKMKILQKESWELNRQNKLKRMVESRVPLSVPTNEDGSPKKFWESIRYSFTRNSEYWEKAQDFRDLYDSLKYCASTDLMNSFGIDTRKRHWFNKLLRYFDGGWIPKQDPLWIEDFKKEAASGSPVTEN